MVSRILTEAVLGLTVLYVAGMVVAALGMLGALAVDRIAGWLGRRGNRLDVAALRVLAADDAAHAAGHSPLLVEIYAAQMHARFGDDITQGAPKEGPWT